MAKGQIISWNKNPGNGRVKPDQGQPLTVFREDCCTDLLMDLDAGKIPVRVTYTPDFSSGNPIALDACFESVGVPPAAVFAARALVAPKPAKKTAKKKAKKIGKKPAKAKSKPKKGGKKRKKP